MRTKLTLPDVLIISETIDRRKRDLMDTINDYEAVSVANIQQKVNTRISAEFAKEMIGKVKKACETERERIRERYNPVIDKVYALEKELKGY